MNLVFAKSGLFVKKSQKGFTLLELLVVITLLAILSVGALIAYEGIGDTAQATAASNNTARADQAIRHYKAVTQEYPDQWDNLVASGAVGIGGVLPAFANDVMGTWLARLPITVPAAAGNGMDRLLLALDNVGVEELQSRTQVAATLGVEPNLQHNEGALNGLAHVQEEQLVDEVTAGTFAGGTLATTHIAVLPTFGSVACSATTAAITPPAARLDGVAVTVADQRRMNAINDALEDDQCNIVVALGFGHDAAHSTNGSSVAISTAPTFVSQNINPNVNYARYVALFHVASDNGAGNVLLAENNIIEDAEVFDRARLIAVVDTEGRVIDENIAAATDESAN